MKISQAVSIFFDYQRLNVKKNTIRNYEIVLSRFEEQFGDMKLTSISSEDLRQDRIFTL